MPYTDKNRPANNGKHPGGRPTKYHPSMCNDIIEFFDRPLYIKKKISKWIDGKEEIIEKEVPNKTPYIIDWVMKHGLSVDTPSNWAKQYPEFFQAFTKAKSLQERFICELGIQGEFNSFMSFCALKNVSGWRDKTELDANINNRYLKEDFKDMSDEEVMRLAKDIVK